MEFVIGGIAAASAGVFTNPFEVLKHHMELNKKSHTTGELKTFLQTGYHVAKTKGVKSLQKGLSPAVCSHLVSYGMKLGTYQFASNRGYTKNSNGEVIVFKSVALSGIGGILGQYLSSPFYFVKAQNEIDALMMSRNSDIASYWNTIKNIYKENGIRGFFRGATASLPRAFIGTSQLTSFAIAKEQLIYLESLKDHQFFATILASCFAAVVLSIAMTPFDMILTKLYKQAINPISKEFMYEGFFDCIKKTYISNGFKPFYSGFAPIGLKLGPHTVLCLLFWEGLKDLYDEHQDRELENNCYRNNREHTLERYNPDTLCDLII